MNWERRGGVKVKSWKGDGAGGWQWREGYEVCAEWHMPGCLWKVWQEEGEEPAFDWPTTFLPETFQADDAAHLFSNGRQGDLCGYLLDAEAGGGGIGVERLVIQVLYGVWNFVEQYREEQEGDDKGMKTMWRDSEILFSEVPCEKDVRGDSKTW